ncbi:MAG: STAS domain-containing protein [Coriobacteriales bacterium]|nr:STAS domain-containing protein [Coriobacteriales bacterium]
MSVAQNIDGSKATIVVDGWLDTQSAPELAEVLNGLPDGVEELTLDFSDLEYISSAGVRLIVSAYKKMGGKLVICNASAEVIDVLTMTGVAKRITII